MKFYEKHLLEINKDDKIVSKFVAKLLKYRILFKDILTF